MMIFTLENTSKTINPISGWIEFDKADLNAVFSHFFDQF